MMKRILAIALLTACTAAAQGARVVVFQSSSFPTIDAPVIPERVIAEAMTGLPVTRTDDLSGLDKDALLVLPYGSAFPLDSWTEIRTFVKSGGSLVVLGGAPFHQPVRKTADGWQLATRQPTFAHEFLIGPAEPISAPAAMRTVFPDPSWSRPMSGARTVWELTVRLARQMEFPAEHGSEGPREGIVRPLVHLVDEAGLPRACPLVEIDRLRGPETGARWIFATSDAVLDAPTIRAIVTRAMKGAEFFEARPAIASILATETPRIQITKTGGNASSPGQLVVRDDAGGVVHRQSVALTSGDSTLDIKPRRALAPGLHHVEISADGFSTTTGFWVRDDTLLKSGPRISVSRDWLRRDGAVFPIVGTTYMASDVHREFLFEPDPHVFDRDFALMERVGINFVRTGLWTAWSRAMSSDGVPNETFLRALDAYVQSAAKHGIVVAFTFYAFLPLPHGGTNPYLDPKSLAGQKTFLSAVATRYRGVGWIHYDLINEPSYAPPEGLWSNRPIRDEHERAAWREWVRTRHGEDITLLRSRWQDRSDSVLDLPRDSDIWYTQIREDRRPRKHRDFVEFSQEVTANWASTLRGYLRDAGGDVLVTLGQDEGGVGTRPSQQLHAASIDYTCLHPWWQNDDLLASGVFVKVPEKPSVFQETGIMRLEDLDGWPWRSPELAASVLERKFAYAFAARAAGNIEWAWNINPYMPIDNESVIGFFRPDGTAKPEINVIPSHARFFAQAAPWLDDFEPDPVVVVIPQSRQFMNRPAALDGYRRLIRLLAERHGIVPTALSDLRLTAERLRDARLIIVPSVEVLGEAAAAALLAASQRGAKVLFTGAITGDAYGEIPASLAALGVVDRGLPVPFRAISDGLAATFDRGLQETLLRGSGTRRESGNIWYEPLPLEHAREEEPMSALLTRALAAAGVETHPSTTGVAARLLTAPRSVLGVFVNDTSADAQRAVTINGQSVSVNVPAGRARLVLYDRKTGRVITQTD
jgi:hypothetical protein